jgi:hypothetical protein
MVSSTTAYPVAFARLRILTLGEHIVLLRVRRKTAAIGASNYECTTSRCVKVNNCLDFSITAFAAA